MSTGDDGGVCPSGASSHCPRYSDRSDLLETAIFSLSSAPAFREEVADRSRAGACVGSTRSTCCVGTERRLYSVPSLSTGPCQRAMRSYVLDFTQPTSSKVPPSNCRAMFTGAVSSVRPERRLVTLPIRSADDSEVQLSLPGLGHLSRPGWHRRWFCRMYLFRRGQRISAVRLLNHVHLGCQRRPS